MVTIPLSPAILAASGVDQWVDQMFDETFAGIHQLSWFDLSLMIPYFGVLFILSVYGVYRYKVVQAYYRHGKNLPAVAPTRFEQLPRVTIQLPVYNERYVIERLLESAIAVEYPRELLQIQVLDDSTDDTHPFTESLCEHYRALGFPVEYHHRSNRHGFKAGALQEGLKTATGEFVAIFDADFVIPADFLHRTVHFFADPQVGVVQTRWTYLNRDYNLLTKIQAILLDGHFVLEHGSRCGEGLYFNFNGTAGILRREMIDNAGGWQHDTLTEDCDLSYRAQLKGWRFVYVPQVECPSELPVDMHGFQVQQSRWAKGLTQVARKLLGSIFRADVPWKVKAETFFHLTPNISYPLMIIILVLMLPVMICRFYMGWFQMLTIDLPLIMASFWSIWAFYLAAQRELYPRTWKRTIFLLPGLMAVGVVLSVSNTRAVVEALFGVQSAFVRTPKYAIGTQKVSLRNARYRSKCGWLPLMELSIAAGFLAVAYYCVISYNFFVLPFLALFISGYLWAGLAKLYLEWQGILAFHRERRLQWERAN